MFQSCFSHVPISLLGPKMTPPRGHMLYIDLYREKHEKIFLSETTRPRALIFGMKHHLVDHYHVCSNSTPGGHMLDLNREK